MIVDCISDLHGYYPKLEGGDLLIVAGDLTARDHEYEYREVYEWFWMQNYAGIVFIGGNHDNNIGTITKQGPQSIQYLCDSGTEFLGLKIWGSPWTKTFKGMNPHCKAFTMEDDCQIGEKFKLIPDDTDILITHSPPLGILDVVQRWPDMKMENCGSGHLRTHVERIKPKLHVFGHIHEGYGKLLLKHQGPNTWCVNASHVNEVYDPINKPIRIIL
jgi:Icc-related predicted phosphoesterase